MIERLVGPTSFPPTTPDSFSLLSYNILLPNSEDGWWTYKMYLPPLTGHRQHISSWKYRSSLISERLAMVDSDVVCLQEVSPESFESDFAFMREELGYDGCEMFKRGRFRPATFWKTDRVDLVMPPVHKDRTLLTVFRKKNDPTDPWFVLNCHLQAGPNGPRRVRQINEGVRGIMTAARKLKIQSPETSAAILICGDFNGGAECGAIRYLEDGGVDETFCEDGQPVASSGPKRSPFRDPFVDVASLDREPPPTMVVTELISQLINFEAGGVYDRPKLSQVMLEKLKTIYEGFATQDAGKDTSMKLMCRDDVERYLTAINGQLGRGSEYREAVRQMTKADCSDSPVQRENEGEVEASILPQNSTLSLEGFCQIYQAELEQGKFWGIAHDMAVLGQAMADNQLFQARYDRIYCSTGVQAKAVMDFECNQACPNDKEPSDHLPVAAVFLKNRSEPTI